MTDLCDCGHRDWEHGGQDGECQGRCEDGDGRQARCYCREFEPNPDAEPWGAHYEMGVTG